mmetsp:Transcript_2425/g.4907  ORF Transcript_2425/g.4907 Transcript_2425/m.4907 type:complete len:229 (+) Transcript_2425:1336-2022(+)
MAALSNAVDANGTGGRVLPTPQECQMAQRRLQSMFGAEDWIKKSSIKDKHWYIWGNYVIAHQIKLNRDDILANLPDVIQRFQKSAQKIGKPADGNFDIAKVVDAVASAFVKVQPCAAAAAPAPAAAAVPSASGSASSALRANSRKAIRAARAAVVDVVDTGTLEAIDNFVTALGRECVKDSAVAEDVLHLVHEEGFSVGMPLLVELRDCFMEQLQINDGRDVNFHLVK